MTNNVVETISKKEDEFVVRIINHPKNFQSASVVLVDQKMPYLLSRFYLSTKPLNYFRYVFEAEIDLDNVESLKALEADFIAISTSLSTSVFGTSGKPESLFLTIPIQKAVNRKIYIPFRSILSRGPLIRFVPKSVAIRDTKTNLFLPNLCSLCPINSLRENNSSCEYQKDDDDFRIACSRFVTNSLKLDDLGNIIPDGVPGAINAEADVNTDSKENSEDTENLKGAL